MLRIGALPAHSFHSLTHNLDKIGFEAGPTDQCTIDIGMGYKLTDVVRGNTSTIQDTYRSSGLFAIHLLIKIADKVNDLTRAFGSRSPSRPDGPDWFIRDNNLRRIRRIQIGQACMYLIPDEVVRLTSFILFQVFTYTHNWT